MSGQLYALAPFFRKEKVLCPRRLGFWVGISALDTLENRKTLATVASVNIITGG